MAASVETERLARTRGQLLLAAQARKGATSSDSREIITNRIDRLLDEYLEALRTDAVTITA